MPFGFTRTRRIATLAAFVVFYVVNAWLVYSVLDGTISDWPWLYPALASTGGSALLGIWAALSPRPLWLRVPNALLLLMCSVAVLFWAKSDQPPRFLEGLARAIFVGFYVGSFVVAWLLWSLMRRFRGWRLVPLDAIELPLSDCKAQVNLWVLFAETLLVGILLGLMRLAPAEYWKDLWEVEQLLIMGLMVLCLAPMLAPLVPIVWLVLSAERVPARLRARAVLLATVLLISGIGVIGVLSDRWEQFLSFCEIAGLAYLGVITALMVLRLGGFRLTTPRRKNPSPLGSAASAAVA